MEDIKNKGFLINEKTNTFTANIITVNGMLSAAQQTCIGEAARLFGNGKIKLSTSFTIEVQGIAYENIDAFLDYIGKESLETGGVGSRIRPVVSCIGNECKFGLADTLGLSDEIHEKIYRKYKDINLPHRFKIAIGGCPNDCAKINLCEVAILAQQIPYFKEDMCKGCSKCSIEKLCPMNACKLEDKKLNQDKTICNNCGRCIDKCHFDAMKKRLEGYKIFIGGKGGKIKTDAIALNKIFTSKEEIIELIEKIILFYMENGQPKERFAKTIERIGFKKVEDILLSE